MHRERTLVWLLWLGWAAYWIVAARHTAANRRTESWQTGFSYRVPLLFGLILLVFSRPSGTLAGYLLWPPSVLTLATGIACIVVGLGMAVWARHHLGKYWSGRVTLKVDHRVIQSGPYGWVRHPIYSGLLLALLGTVITVGTIQSCVAFAIIFVAVRRKLMFEERWMSAHFGEEYDLYRRRVKALIPGRQATEKTGSK
jgi:protein-S-isoprenylcysteine O-methyltransferase Ste14